MDAAGRNAKSRSGLLHLVTDEALLESQPQRYTEFARAADDALINTAKRRGESAQSVPRIGEIGAEEGDIPVTVRRHISDPGTEEPVGIIGAHRFLESWIAMRLEIIDPAVVEPGRD